jgi:serine/threonine protein kinase
MSHFSPVPNSLEKKPKTKIKHQSARIGNYIYFTPAVARGAYSQVFVGYHVDQSALENPTYVAIKRITSEAKKKMSMSRIQREIDLLKLLKHPNIVNFQDAFPDIAENIYIVTEYCNYGDLDRFTRKEMLDHEEIRDYMSQLRDGLYYLLKNNILHRDLKPKNILLQKHPISGQITLKIADFGFAKIFENLTDDSMMETLCGTPMYLSPEMVKSRKYSLNSDLWSVGVMIYQLFYHCLPFARPRNILELMKSLENMKLIFPPEPTVCRDVKELMSSLLQLDPQQRSSWGNFFGASWLPTLLSDDETSIIPSLANISKESENDEDDPIFESCKASEVYSDIIDEKLGEKEEKLDEKLDEKMKLEDSGIQSQARKLLKPVPPAPDELELYGHSSRMFGALNLKDDHFELRSASSVPSETKIIIPLGSMYISTTHSISPTIRPFSSKESPSSLVLDRAEIPSLTGSEEQLYERSRTVPSIRQNDEKDVLTPKHEIIIAKHLSRNGYSSRKLSFTNSEWLSSNITNSLSRSGEDIAKIVGDVMNSSAAWFGKNLSSLSPYFRGHFVPPGP